MPQALVILRPFFMIGYHPVNVDHAYNVILLIGEIFVVRGEYPGCRLISTSSMLEWLRNAYPI